MSPITGTALMTDKTWRIEGADPVDKAVIATAETYLAAAQGNTLVALILAAEDLHKLKGAASAGYRYSAPLNGNAKL